MGSSKSKETQPAPPPPPPESSKTAQMPVPVMPTPPPAPTPEKKPANIVMQPCMRITPEVPDSASVYNQYKSAAAVQSIHGMAVHYEPYYYNYLKYSPHI